MKPNNQLATLLARAFILSLFSIATSASGNPSSLADFNRTLEIHSGKIHGGQDLNSTVSWKGIPYAAAPIGELRWQAPQDVESWDRTMRTRRFGNKCVQFVTNINSGRVTLEGNENCLFLNVWRPDTYETDLPVYVWIHGGGNQFGHASEPDYDGSFLANRLNAIVISMNYRLGPFGAFNSPALETGDPATDSGNFIVLDLIKSLQWIQTNITTFGGNTNNVTIAGESAGGVNVTHLMLSPLANGLFHKAVVQSGGTLTYPDQESEQVSDRHINALLNRAGLDRNAMTNTEISDYLRSLSPRRIMSYYSLDSLGQFGDETLQGEWVQAFNDDYVIPSDGIAAFARGEYNQVPLLQGYNKEEAKLVMAFDSASAQLSDCEYQAVAEKITQEYWAEFIVNPAAQLIKEHQDVFSYRFDYGSHNYQFTFDPVSGECSIEAVGFNAWNNNSDSIGPDQTNYQLRMGSAHTLDIPFLLGMGKNLVFFGIGDQIFREDNAAGRDSMSAEIADFMGRFIRTGNPNSPGSSLWESWNSNSQYHPQLILDADASNSQIRMNTP